MKINYTSRYFKWGLTLFLSLCATVLFYFFMKKFGIVSDGLIFVLRIVRPFIYGLAITYLLCPVYNAIMRVLDYIFIEKLKRKRYSVIFKIISTFGTLTFIFVIFGGLIMLVFPQMVESAIQLGKTAPESFGRMVAFLQRSIQENEHIHYFAKIAIGDYTEDLYKWIETMAIPQIIDFAKSFSDSIFGIFKVMTDLLLGIIVSIYLLNSKDTFSMQSKKTIYALFENENATKVINEFRFINKTFGSFINGKILDSAIIGVLCFIAMLFLGIPYAVLVSVIVGVTNIIPFFGPFIGAIPSVIIILTEDPIKALYFMILILVLQQLDGNVIGPKILGDSTGLSGFWVLFAILLGGGLFGFVGMIVGIPIFAILYTYTKRYIDSRLEKKNMPVGAYYYDIDVPIDKNRKGSK